MAGTRIVRGLQWAIARDSGPFGTPRARLGAKGNGIRYERALAAALPGWKHGQWWEFGDAAGGGWCQTDLVLRGRNACVVLECKYTWTESAIWQLEGLYRPVVEMAWGLPMLGVTVCKVLTPGVDRGNVVGDLMNAIALARQGRQPVLHWLGNVQLGDINGNSESKPTKSLAEAISLA